MTPFDIASLEKELHTSEKQTEEPSFWEDSQNSSRILKRINELKNKTENYKKISSTFEYIEELNEYMMQNSEKQEWGKINFESQIGEFFVPVVLKEVDLEMMRTKIYSLVKRHITLGQDFLPEESLFNVGVITEITVKKLFESLSELFNITINLKNISPKDIVGINNLVLAIQRICIEQGKWYV